MKASESFQVEAYLDKAKGYQYEQKDSALYFVRKAMELADPEDYGMMASIKNRKGAVYYISGEYDLSLRHYVEALELAKKGEDKPAEVTALNGRGLIYLADKDFEQAIKVWKDCLPINMELSDSVSLAINHFNIGIAFDELKAYDSAIYHLQASLDFLETNRGDIVNLMAKNRMAKVHSSLLQYDKAMQLYQEVLDAKDLLTNWESTFAYTGMAEVALEKGEIKTALEYGQLALKMAEAHGGNWDMERITHVMGEIYEKAGEFSKALYFTRMNKAYHDSLYNTAKNRQISRLQLELSHADNERLRAEKSVAEHQIRQHYRLTIFMVLVVVFLFTLVYFYRKNLLLKEHFNIELGEKNRSIQQQNEMIDKQNQLLKEINQTKTKLLSILSHDLRSPMNSIKQLLMLQQEGYFTEVDREEAMALLHEQVENTERMLNNLLQWANKQTDGMEVNPESFDMTVVVDDLVTTYGFQTKAKRIKVIHSRQSLPEVWMDKAHFQIIVQNLLGNAVKFTPYHGEISLFYTPMAHKILFHIKDSGEGIDDVAQDIISGVGNQRMLSQVGTANETGTGLGLLLVKQFVALNQGEIDVRSIPGSGTEFILGFGISERG
ncbi:tetratricopeptide repeat protein [Negadavirga shengliensis]|uniref:histidine kinase n=1 Tax=Negadavirga shengliensis TaxID=1389218 RepID=A0ABV9T2P6_9BACT